MVPSQLIELGLFAVDVGDKSRPIIASGGSGRLTICLGINSATTAARLQGIPPWIYCRQRSADTTAKGYGEMVTLIVVGEVGTDGMIDRPRSAQSFGRI